jgi:hypothetical protein
MQVMESSPLPAGIDTVQNANRSPGLNGILFRAAAETLRTIAADPKHLGAEIATPPTV